MRRSSGAWTSRIAGFLGGCFVPGRRIGRQLVVISLFGAFGSGMYYTCSALYLTTMVGLTAGQVGAGLSIAAMAGLLGALPAGMLADRWRAGPVYIGLQLMRGLVFAAFCLVSTYPQVAVACAFAGLTEAALPSLQQAVVGATVPGAERVDTRAKVRAARCCSAPLPSRPAPSCASRRDIRCENGLARATGPGPRRPAATRSGTERGPTAAPS